MTIWQPDISEHSGPRYVAIADVLATDIRSRRLAPGDRLPTHRELAYRLGVTVGTVTRAYGEAQRRGLIEGEIGRGTFVRRDPVFLRQASPLAIVSSAQEAGEKPIPLHFNHPADLNSIGLEGDVLRRTLDELAATGELSPLLNYQPHGGLARHREAGARYLRDFGIEIAPERLIVTAGAQHAMFVAAGAITEPGDLIVTEALTWPGLRRLGDFLRVRIQGLPLDSEGIMPDALAAACRARKVKALYCVPNLQNPTTLIMPEARRRELAEVARQYGVRIIEDDVYGFLVEDRPPPLVSFAPELGLYLSSLSKSMAPGLRIGYLAVMGEAMAGFNEAMQSTIYMASPLCAEIATRWIDDGIGTRIRAARRLDYARRQELAARILVDLPRRTHPNSMHLWLELPEHWPADAFALEARIRGVAICPTSNFAQMRQAPNGVRVSLTLPQRQGELERGLATLVALYRAQPNRANDIV